MGDGVVIGAAEEERFSRIKHDAGFPIHAIEFCLRTGRLRGEDLDYVVRLPRDPARQLGIGLRRTVTREEGVLTWLVGFHLLALGPVA